MSIAAGVVASERKGMSSLLAGRRDAVRAIDDDDRINEKDRRHSASLLQRSSIVGAFGMRSDCRQTA
jgi:hypothetical protein